VWARNRVYQYRWNQEVEAERFDAWPRILSNNASSPSDPSGEDGERNRDDGSGNGHVVTIFKKMPVFQRQIMKIAAPYFDDRRRVLATPSPAR